MVKRLNKYKFLIVLVIAIIIIGYPFIFLLLGKIINLGELYTFGLDLKDFITVWITFLGVIGAAIGIFYMHKRVTLQGQQITLQEKQNRDSRFHSAAELLGKDGESTRISGIYSLYFLAKEYPDEYLEPVCEVLCAHVRTITNKSEYQEKYKEKTASEIQTIIDLLFYKDKDKVTIFNSCKKNLKGTFLSRVSFYNTILYDVDFDEAKLIHVDFDEAKLLHVRFDEAKLTHVDFDETKLTIVNFNYATLTHVDFRVAKLNNVYFDNAIIDSINFYNAKLDYVDFTGTHLEGYSYEDITKEDFSLDWQ